MFRLRTFFPRVPKFQRVTAHADAVVEYETFILNADGSVASTRKRKRNLILDQGLNLVGTVAWCACFENCAVGTGTNPTNRDSGATTFTRVTTVITASAGFFAPADVGRLLKWDSGEEVYITGYTSATIVACVTGAGIGPGVGTIWYVNDTGLQTEAARTAILSTDAGDNETTFANPTLTNKRTFLFPAVGAPVTYKEIGWSNSAAVAANLFGRDLIPGLGDSLLTGQQYKVIVRLLLTLSPVAVTAVGDVGNNGFVTSGNANHEYILNAYSSIASPGGATVAGPIEPGSVTTFNGVVGAFTLLTAPSFTTNNTGDFCRASLTNAAYTNGNFFRDSTGTVAVGSGNGSLTAFTFGAGLGGAVSRAFSQKFTSAQTKDNVHTLIVSLRKSWGRILTN